MQWNETDMIGRWISFLYRYGQIYMDKQLKRFKLSSGQSIFFLVLFNNDGLSQENVAYSLNIDKGTTAVAMKKLEKEGYIHREVDENDKRCYRIFITEKALNIQDEFINILTTWTDTLTNGFTEEEKKVASSLLQRMNDNARNILKKERKIKNEK